MIKKTMLWRCHRGMLELDLILIPFVERDFDTLSQEHIQDLCALLEEPDPDLFAWFMGTAKAPEPKLQALVEYISQRHQAKTI
jgi:antitoxin CptB